jgi:hydroxyethylthiazole kinase-like sugar kinase family protein
MPHIKRLLIRLALSLVLSIGLVSGAHEALAQNAAAIANPAQLPNVFNPNTNPNQNSIFNPNPFQNSLYL